MGVGSVVLGLIGHLLTAPIGKAASAAVGWALTKLDISETGPSHGTELHDGRGPRTRDLPADYHEPAVTGSHARRSGES